MLQPNPVLTGEHIQCKCNRMQNINQYNALTFTSVTQSFILTLSRVIFSDTECTEWIMFSDTECDHVLMKVIQASLNNLNLSLITFKENKRLTNLCTNIVNYQE